MDVCGGREGGRELGQKFATFGLMEKVLHVLYILKCKLDKAWMGL